MFSSLFKSILVVHSLFTGKDIPTLIFKFQQRPEKQNQYKVYVKNYKHIGGKYEDKTENVYFGGPVDKQENVNQNLDF